MVVPYNFYLLKKYKGHINIEVCSTLMSVKYLYKYLTKGNDTATFRVVTSDNVNQTQLNYDEIEQFIHTRYITPPEAVWMIFDFKNTRSIAYSSTIRYSFTSRAMRVFPKQFRSTVIKASIKT